MGAQLNPGVVCETTDVSYGNSAYINKTGLSIKRPDRYYVPAGQSTQMIVGATGESDYQIISVAEAMYNRFDMKRVFYSAFVNVNMDESLPGVGQPPQLRREHRLYQADFLMRFYGFKVANFCQRTIRALMLILIQSVSGL